MTADDHRRAGRLMADALAQGADLRDVPGLTPLDRAVLTVGIILRASRLWPKRYSEAEAAWVRADFERAWAQLAATRAD